MPFNPVIIVAKGKKPGWYKATEQYLQRDIRKALWQLLTTLIPYLLLLVLMARTVRQGYPYAITLGLGVITAALLTRIFILFHDCTHGALLPSPRWNRKLGYLCVIWQISVSLKISNKKTSPFDHKLRPNIIGMQPSFKIYWQRLI